MKRPALQNKQVVLLRMAFRARKVLGTFEKRAPGPRIKITYFSLLEDKKDHDGFPRASAGERSFVTGSKK